MTGNKEVANQERKERGHEKKIKERTKTLHGTANYEDKWGDYDFLVEW